MPESAKRHGSPARKTGKLIYLKESGYGFIQSDDGSGDYYVAISSMRDRRDWKEGLAVSFIPGRPHQVADGAKRKATPAWDVAVAEAAVDRQRVRKAFAPRGKRA